MKELVASLSSEGFSSVCAHRCRHRRKMNLGLGRRQGLQSVKRRGGNSWAVLARAPPEPGGNRNPQNSHSVWTRRERGKTCPKLRRTHWERKEHFCWEKPPKPTTASHLQTPKPTTVSHCPQGTLLSPRSGCGRACRPHGQMGVWESSTLPAWKRNRSQEKGEESKVTSVMANTLLPSGLLRKGTKLPQHQLPLALWGCSREGSARRELSKELLSLPGLWNNQR